jgi:hypothetical protein
MLSDELRKDVDKLIEIESPRTFSSIDWHPYGGKVPEALIEIWQKVGCAAWREGSYQSINPGLYTNIEDIAFQSSPLDSAAAVPYIMSAFGRLTTWHPQYGLINIDPIFGKNSIPKSPQKRALGASSGDIEILSGFPILDPDEENFNLFRAAVQKLGVLGENEIFAFVPSLPFGGRAHIDCVQKCAADVHLDLLAQSTAFETFYIEGTLSNARLVKLE